MSDVYAYWEVCTSTLISHLYLQADLQDTKFPFHHDGDPAVIKEESLNEMWTP